MWFLSHRKQTQCLLQRPVSAVQVKTWVSQSICNVLFMFLFCWQCFSLHASIYILNHHIVGPTLNEHVFCCCGVNFAALLYAPKKSSVQ